MLPLVEGKPWISTWHTTRSMIRQNHSVTVQVFESASGTAREEISLPSSTMRTSWCYGRKLLSGSSGRPSRPLQTSMLIPMLMMAFSRCEDHL